MSPNAPATPEESRSPSHSQPQLLTPPQPQLQPQLQPQPQPPSQLQLQLYSHPHPQPQLPPPPPPHQLLHSQPPVPCRLPYDHFIGFSGEPGPALAPLPEQPYPYAYPPPPAMPHPPMPYGMHPPLPTPHMMGRHVRGPFPRHPRHHPYAYAPFPPPFFYGRPPPHFMLPLPPNAQARRAAKKPHVPRPPNAFMLFRSDFLRRTQNPEKRQQHLSRMAGEAWHSISDEERAEWMQRAADVAQKHNEEHPDWKYVPAPKSGGRGGPLPIASGSGAAGGSGGSGIGHAAKAAKSPLRPSTRRARDDDDDEYVERSSKRRRRQSPKPRSEHSDSDSDSPQILSPTLAGSPIRPSSSSLPPLRPTLPPIAPLEIDPPKPPPTMPMLLGPSVPYHHSVPPVALGRRPSTATGVRPSGEKAKVDDLIAQPVPERPASAIDFDSLTRRQSLSQDKGASGGAFGFPSMGLDFASGSGLGSFDPWAQPPFGFPASGTNLGVDNYLSSATFDTTFDFGSSPFDAPFQWAPEASGSQQPASDPQNSPAE